MLKLRCILFTLLVIFLLTPIVLAEEFEGEVEREYNFQTGRIWGVPGYKVLFQVSDYQIAEVFKAKNGEVRVRFTHPGDVYVKAIFYLTDGSTDERLYLFHISGDETGETAIDRSNFANRVLELVNEERAKKKLKPLKLAEDLCQWADIRAKECVEVFAHVRPNGDDGVNIITSKKYNIKGENISRGSSSPEQVMYEWMHSPTHRDNILFPDYTELGVGYYYEEDFMKPYRHYWVQLFGRSSK